MRLSSRHRKANPGPNMTSMVDIVFLLIVFFMTVSQVSEANRDNVVLPELEGSKDQSTQTLTINIDPSGVMRISGNVVTLPQLISLAQAEIANVGGNPAMVTVVIRADENGRCETVNDVVEGMSQLRIDRIRFAVQVPQ
ncbi:MAG: biopolymer transporter ExbD [Pirellulaceae bacterium]